MGYNLSDTGATTYRWHDLALDVLLPPDLRREEQERARIARRMANVAGTGSANQQPSANAVGANTTAVTTIDMDASEAEIEIGTEDEEDEEDDEEEDEEDEDEDGDLSEEGSEG